MSLQSGIDHLTDQLAQLSPAGYSFSLHFRYAVPLLHKQTFSTEWQDHYVAQSYALRDPTIAWGFSKTGTCRWNELPIPDPFKIMDQMKSFGMVHGFVVSCGPMTSRTIASAARADRDFTDVEIAEFAKLINHLHDVAEPPRALTNAQIQALRCIAEGDRHTAAAARLNISESALKARLSSARSSLLARTTAEAIQRARDYRLL